MITDIYVKILNEDLLVWRPIKAKNLNNSFFQIIDKTDFINKFDEELEFKYGEIVQCKYINGEYYAIKNVVLD